MKPASDPIDPHRRSDDERNLDVLVRAAAIKASTFISEELSEPARKWALEMDEALFPASLASLLGLEEVTPLHTSTRLKDHVRRAVDMQDSQNVEFSERLEALRRTRDQELVRTNSIAAHYEPVMSRARDLVHEYETLSESSGISRSEAEQARQRVSSPIRELWAEMYAPQDVAERDGWLRRLVESSLAVAAYEAVNEGVEAITTRPGRAKAKNQDELYLYALKSMAHEITDDDNVSTLWKLIRRIDREFGSSGKKWPNFSYGKLKKEFIDEGFIKEKCLFDPKEENIVESLRDWYKDTGGVLPPRPPTPIY